MVVFGVVAVVFSARAARHPSLDRPTRRATRVLTVALVLALATPLIFLVTGPKSVPAPGDAAHLAFAVVLFVALQLLPLRAASRRERAKTLLDALSASGLDGRERLDPAVTAAVVRLGHALGLATLVGGVEVRAAARDVVAPPG